MALSECVYECPNESACTKLRAIVDFDANYRSRKKEIIKQEKRRVFLDGSNSFERIAAAFSLGAVFVRLRIANNVRFCMVWCSNYFTSRGIFKWYELIISSMTSHPMGHPVRMTRCMSHQFIELTCLCAGVWCAHWMLTEWRLFRKSLSFLKSVNRSIE